MCCLKRPMILSVWQRTAAASIQWLLILLMALRWWTLTLQLAPLFPSSRGAICFAPDDSSFGYRPGRSTASAAGRIEQLYNRGYRWVVDADIERYFDSICHFRMARDLLAIVPDPDLERILWKWLRGIIRGRGHDYALTRGVAQGSPLSPLLANLYLDPFDEWIADNGFHHVRYADDFVVLCRSERRANEALRAVRSHLGFRGLRLNRRKTRITHFDRGFRFLGYRFVKSLVIRTW